MGNRERPHNLNAYFGLFKGEAHTLSEMTPDVKPAIEILRNEGQIIEQLALDGDHLIFMPEKVRSRIQSERDG